MATSQKWVQLRLLKSGMPELAVFGLQNHFMLGQINQWFFNDLVSIKVDAEGAGFHKSIIKPEIVSGIEWVKGFY